MSAPIPPPVEGSAIVGTDDVRYRVRSRSIDGISVTLALAGGVYRGVVSRIAR